MAIIPKRIQILDKKMRERNRFKQKYGEPVVLWKDEVKKAVKRVVFFIEAELEILP